MLLGQVLHQLRAGTLLPHYPHDQRARGSHTNDDLWRDLCSRLSWQWSFHLGQLNRGFDLLDCSVKLQHDVVRYDRPRHCSGSSMAWLCGCEVQRAQGKVWLLYEGVFRELEDNDTSIWLYLLQDLPDLVASSMQPLSHLLDMCAGAWSSLSLVGHMLGATQLPLVLLVLGAHRAPIHLLALFHALLSLETKWESQAWRSGRRVFVHVAWMVNPSHRLHLRGRNGNLDLQTLLLPLMLRYDSGLHCIRNDQVSLCQLRD